MQPLEKRDYWAAERRVTGDDRLNTGIETYGVKPADGAREEYEDDYGVMIRLDFINNHQ